MFYINPELQELCEKNDIDIKLLQELIKIEKGNLSSNRGASHKMALETAIKNSL